jgi:hypothetical protein
VHSAVHSGRLHSTLPGRGARSERAPRPGPWCRASRSWGSWGAAAWASSTRRGRRR